MKKRILVTGASGYIGYYCIPLLIDTGYDVHAISRSKFPYKNDMTWHCADLMDTAKISELVSNIEPSHCLHLAWHTEHGKFWDAPNNHDWVKASLSLFEVFAKSGGQRAVIAGSCAEYDWKYGICSEYSTPINPRTIYGQCKNELHQQVIELSKLVNLNYAWARLFYLYGGNEDPNRLIPSICCSLLKGEIAKTSSGEQQRDFMYVRDASAALIAVLNSNYTGAVNIATGQVISVRDLATMIAKKIGRVDLLDSGALKLSKEEPLLLAAETAILNNVIKFIPSTTLDMGLQEAIKFWNDKLKKSSTLNAMSNM